MNPLFTIPEDFAALSVEDLNAFVAEAQATVESVVADPSVHLSDTRNTAALMDEMQAGVAAIESARAELASREPEDAPVEEPSDELEIDTDALAALAARAAGDAEEDEPEEVEEPEVEPEATAAVEAVEPEAVEPEPAAAAVEPEPAVEPVTAAAPAPARRAPLARPSRSRAATPQAKRDQVALVAAASSFGPALGEELSAEGISEMMIKARRLFGNIPEGTHGERIPIATADWRDRYSEDRRLDESVDVNMAKIAAVTAAGIIRENFEARRKTAPDSLVASGGLCAPVTNYYGLMELAVADRPVRAALPAFNADRGGIRHARPAGLSAIDDAVGLITEAEDAAGGSLATKSCQVIDCPAFEEVDVSTIYKCLQFGNLGARTFPELVAQWQSLVMAAHAREGETALLDGIGGASTAVTAGALGLGASATLPSQILAAAAGYRSRNRMRDDAVLRVLLPTWVLELLVSDVYRSQFDRFDMGKADFVRILRDANVEPSFYMDSETGAGQVFGSQTAGALHGFPSTIVWYLYSEGSFLYLDGGVLELGLVRDSVLNSTNDFQLFGESFENVAFIGVESLKVTSTTCDIGVVAAPKTGLACPVTY